ncbi:MAG: adenylate cyclase [Actinomycetaceae bacterium]|nr:adenylate cyclase [Arcanobacterium sp.]MDD7505496.1 adenylate cyclase [Actinomycetaceae bacterium]MDY6143477.1 adenylate cyclase [Arcanobacterium sp.]
MADGEQYDVGIPFEYERKFLVRELPLDVLAHGTRQLIVQSYVFAEGGYAIRVRITFTDVDIDLPRFDEPVDRVGAYERRVLARLLAQLADDAEINDGARSDDGEHAGTAHAQALMAVKSPAINGERYELETELDLDVATQILQRSKNLIFKQRYSLWINEDGWEFDVFGGENRGLIVAECERLTPVVDLEIPDFCVTEVTADPRFTNDSLSKEPWSQWDTLYGAELAAKGPFFLNLKR